MSTDIDTSHGSRSSSSEDVVSDTFSVYYGEDDFASRIDTSDEIVAQLAKTKHEMCCILSLSQVEQIPELACRKSHHVHMVEGSSASVYPKRPPIETPHKDFCGVFPIRGKFLSITTH